MSNRLSSHFCEPSAVAHHIKNPKRRPTLGQNSPQLEEDSTMKEKSKFRKSLGLKCKVWES